jgi:hypothetical protein
MRRLEALIDAATEELVRLRAAELRIAEQSDRIAAGLPHYEVSDLDPVSDAPVEVVRAWGLVEGLLAPGARVNNHLRRLYYAAGEPEVETPTSKVAAIREWAREHGYEVARFGYIADEVRAAYEEATG